MIHLCYLQRKIADQEEFYDLFLSEIFPHVEYGNDLIITSHKIKKREGLVIQHFNEVDLENLASLKTDNLFLVEFDQIPVDFLRTLILTKSKKTEIIGISNNYVDMYKNIQLDIQNYRELGYADDHIAVALILKDNLPAGLVNSSLTYDRFKLKNTNIREISSIPEITKFIRK